MRKISDDWLLTAAQIAATLIGLLLVGVFFYLEAGFRRVTSAGPQAWSFLRATTKLIVLLFSMVLGLSLGIIALDPVWLTVLFVALSAAIVVGLVQWTLRSRELTPELRRVVRIHPWVGWPVFLVPLALPWVLGGWLPGREDLTWTLFLAGAVAFMTTADLMLLAFDLAAIERAAGDGESTETGGGTERE